MTQERNSEEGPGYARRSWHLSTDGKGIRNQGINTKAGSAPPCHVSRPQPHACRMPLRSVARTSAVALGSMQV